MLDNIAVAIISTEGVGGGGREGRGEGGGRGRGGDLNF